MKKKFNFQFSIFNKYFNFKYLNFISNFEFQIENFQGGFTIIELAITLAVFSILAGFVFINVSQSQHQTYVHTTVDTLVTDIRQQQIKTMAGDTQGTNTIVNYGIHFQPGSYTLFHGSSYSSADSTNFTIMLNPNVQFVTDLFPGANLLFDKGTGELLNFVNGQNAITVKDTATQETKTITVNRYGVITTIN